MNNKPIQVAIVDDEPIAREILAGYLARMPAFELAGSCKNALEAFGLLSKQNIDLLLLDINMPEITGIDFLKTLRNPPLVIFTTAYSEYAVQSYELNALDYLLKPVSFERFIQAMHKASDALHKPVAEKPAAEKTPVPDSVLFVRAEGKWVKIDLTHLWYVEGLKDYLRLWTDEGQVLVHSTMKNFEEQLSAYTHFVRIHKSYIVNLRYITEVNNTAVKIKNEWISIGNTYRDEITRLFNTYKFI